MKHRTVFEIHDHAVGSMGRMPESWLAACRVGAVNWAVVRLLAVASMVVDHAAIIFGGGMGWRLLGRAAIPGFFLLLLAGLERTSSREKYAARLFLVGIVAQGVYSAFWMTDTLCILFTLGLVVLLAERRAAEVVLVVAALAGVEWWRSDVILEGGAWSVGLLVLGHHAGRRWWLASVSAASFAVYLWPFATWWGVAFGAESAAWATILWFGTRFAWDAPTWMRTGWWWYWFYPLHMALLLVLE
ncbi:conjugal transfer protein TraX [Aeoliella sp. ICT_H6.2]|uniref:Conjugal transfer protein TraX n=1 Tax=Aeoliella straminimaris TaxID=2954799 RepID=A0A9X2FCI7_9BACT|nr:TraX family protein [Aeoliella straminimaris]MCO6045532.1 conjugal transfer protein TraX [Aeoliella straminimaris]